MVATNFEQNLSDPHEIELLALFRGIQLHVHLGIQTLIVESDSLQIIHVIQE